MAMHLEVLEVEVTFALPDWFAEERFQVIDSNGDYNGMDSHHERALFAAFPDLTETCVCHGTKWVTIGIPIERLQNVTAAIAEKQMELHLFLGRLKEAYDREKSGCVPAHELEGGPE
jgi:hypothetical protein